MTLTGVRVFPRVCAAREGRRSPPGPCRRRDVYGLTGSRRGRQGAIRHTQTWNNTFGWEGCEEGVEGEADRGGTEEPFVLRKDDHKPVAKRPGEEPNNRAQLVSRPKGEMSS